MVRQGRTPGQSREVAVRREHVSGVRGMLGIVGRYPTTQKSGSARSIPGTPITVKEAANLRCETARCDTTKPGYPFWL